MTDILKRHIAPITQAAWTELDQEASDGLQRFLAARQVVDFDGPHGWEFSAVNTGRVKAGQKAAKGGVSWGTRQVMPLVEFRVPFTLSLQEIESLVRGSDDADMDPLVEAARKAAEFEDQAIFQGFSQGGIEGIQQAGSHKAVKLPTDAEAIPKAVAQAVKTLADEGIEGPYALILGSDAYFSLKQAAGRGYPPIRTISDLIEGEVIRSPVVKGGILLSNRGGDFELTIGQDYSLGYLNHTGDDIELFLTESFTFRVLEPKAAVVLSSAK